MSIYYKYAKYGTNIVVLSYVDDCIYWYTSEALGKWCMDNLGKIFHVNFLGYVHWFVSIRISQMKDHYILVYQDIYATSIVYKYLDTVIFKTSTNFYKKPFTSDIIFTDSDASSSDEQIEKLTKEFNINYKL